VLVEFGVGQVCCWSSLLLAEFGVGQVCCWPSLLLAEFGVGQVCCWPSLLLAEFVVGRVCCWPSLVLVKFVVVGRPGCQNRMRLQQHNRLSSRQQQPGQPPDNNPDNPDNKKKRTSFQVSKFPSFVTLSYILCGPGCCWPGFCCLAGLLAGLLLSGGVVEKKQVTKFRGGFIYFFC